MAKTIQEIAPIAVEIDGVLANVRPLEKRDFDRVRKAYSMLSEESRMNRFWEKPRELSSSRAESLTNTDNRDHIAWFALPRDENDPIPGFGGASFWRDETDSDRAELAFTVGDPWQRRGFATLLFSLLWFEGWRMGLRQFHAVCRIDNTAMVAWWKGMGGQIEEGRRQYELSLELESPEKFVERVSYGIPTSPRQVDLAEWMTVWLEMTHSE